MVSDCQQGHSEHVIQKVFRVIIEKIAILVWHEPITLISRRQLGRLRQLERREMLRLAERVNNQEFLDQELEKVQLSVSDLTGGKQALTPIAQWPDEDFEDAFVAETNKE